jgi:hypothetical protein
MKAKINPFQINGLILIIFFIFVCTPAWGKEPNQKRYVGSEACQQCHEEEYSNFAKYARKSNSFQSILKMKKSLSYDEIKGCYACHTTGYGEPGGFVSPEKTPELKNAGCEVCHGPGGLHSKTQNPKHMNGKITIGVCEKCHTEDRVRSFRYRPILHGGAH